MADTIKVPASSPSGQLNGEDWKKIGKGAAIAFGGAVLASIAEWLIIGNVSWNTFLKNCIPAAVAVGINAVRKYFAGN